MLKHIIAASLTFASLTAGAASLSPEQAFGQVNQQISELPGVAQGVAFTMVVTKLATDCKAPAGTISALQQSVARLVQYATPAVSKDVLSKSIGLGTQMSMMLRSSSAFKCETSGLVQRANTFPPLVDAEIKRAKDPKKFEIARVAPMMK